MEFSEVDLEIAEIASKLTKIPLSRRMQRLEKLQDMCNDDQEVLRLAAKIVASPQSVVLNYPLPPTPPATLSKV